MEYYKSLSAYHTTELHNDLQEREIALTEWKGDPKITEASHVIVIFNYN
jgi:hypothetical protein